MKTRTRSTPLGYLAVYLATAPDLRDVGDDPCFDPPQPTWGICRPSPDIRHKIRPGQYVLFIAKLGDKGFFVRGLFNVAKPISHTMAAQRFPGRWNLLLSTTPPGDTPAWKDKWTDRWAKTGRGKKPRQPQRVPDFLKFLVDGTGRRWWHSANDTHQVDNWMCRRIFGCNIQRLLKCVKDGACQEQGNVDTERNQNYMVGDAHASFVAPSETRYGDVAEVASLPAETELTNEAGRHPTQSLSRIQVTALLCWFRRKGTKVSGLASPVQPSVSTAEPGKSCSPGGRRR